MALGSVGNNPYAQLQSALESARQRTSTQTTPVEQKETEEKRVPRSVGGGSLFQRLYGNKVGMTEQKPVQIGARLDMYA